MLSWAALAAALILVPVARPAQTRANALARRGRLRRPAEPTHPTSIAVPGWVWMWASAAVAAVVGTLAGLAVALAALVALVTAALLARAADRRRRRARATEQLLSAVSLMAAELAAGSSPAAAVLAGAEMSPAHAAGLRALAARVEARAEPGADAESAAVEFAALEHAWRVAATTGAPLAEVWSHVARDLTQQIDQRRAVTTALAGARSSAALLAGLPVVGVLLGTAMQAQPLRVLATTSAGHIVLLLGVCLDAAGLGWTHWLTARAEAP